MRKAEKIDAFGAQASRLHPPGVSPGGDGLRGATDPARRGRLAVAGGTPALQQLRMAITLALLLVLVATAASACPVCYGNAQTPLNKSASNGILFLLGIVGSVQVGFVALFINFWKRTKALQRVAAGTEPADLRLVKGGQSEVDAQ